MKTGKWVWSAFSQMFFQAWSNGHACGVRICHAEWNEENTRDRHCLVRSIKLKEV